MSAVSILLAACSGSKSATGVAGTTPTPVRVINELPSVITSPTPSIAAAPVTSTGYAVFLGPSGDPAGYRLSIVRADGTVIASANAARRSHEDGTPLPVFSTSGTRVYYLDGDREVKSLTLDGKTAHVTYVPGEAHIHAAFAVSPDDRRIAISTISYNFGAPQLRLYVEDLDASNHLELFSSSSVFAWPVGWHEGKIVLAIGDPYETPQAQAVAAHPWCEPLLGACVADNPYAATHGYHLVDPTNANRLATLGSDKCHVIGLLTSAGAVCRESSFAGGVITPTNECRPELTICLRLADWSGTVTDWTTIATIWIGALSTDGTRMAVCCNVDNIDLYAARSAGGAAVTLRKSAAPQAWLDANHLIYQPWQTQNEVISDVTTRLEVTASVQGVPVASLPGGF